MDASPCISSGQFAFSDRVECRNAFALADAFGAGGSRNSRIIRTDVVRTIRGSSAPLLPSASIIKLMNLLNFILDETGKRAQDLIERFAQTFRSRNWRPNLKECGWKHE